MIEDMSRGSLPDKTYSEINSRLPDVSAVFKRAWTFAPDWLSFKFPPGHQGPEASVCFHDCASRLYEIRHALFECFAHAEYYRRVRATPNEMVAVAMERFYLDDAALRMYAAAECLSQAVAAMLNIPRADLREMKRRKQTSDHATIGKYLRAHEPTHPLAMALFELHELPAWSFTMNYRNEWVHTQPPTIAGHGIVYHRGPRWQVDDDGQPVYLARTPGGDTPKLTIEALTTNITGANEGLVRTVAKALDEYEAQVRAVGFTRTETGATRFTLFE